MVSRFLASVVLVSIAAPAWADDREENDRLVESAALSSEDQESARLRDSDIVVTGRSDGYRAVDSVATRDGSTLLDTPQSIQVLTEDLLRDQRADTFSALNNVPSVRNSSSPNFDGLRVQTRGFFAPVALDGLVSRSSAANLGPDLTGIGRVEVLLGPASLLFGSSAPGGTINFVTKQPQSTSAYFLTATVGSYDFYRAEADLTGALDASETILYRLSGSYRDQGSFLEGAGVRNTVLAPSATFALGSRTRLTVEGAYKLLEFDRQNYGLPSVGTVLNNPNGRIPRRRNANEGNEEVEQYRLGFRLTHDFSDEWSLSNITRYVSTDYDVVATFPGALRADNRTLPLTAFDQLNLYDEYQTQTNLKGEFVTGALKHKVLVGFDFYRTNSRFLQDNYLGPPALDIFNPAYGRPRGAFINATDTENRLDEIGVFIQDQIEFGERLRLVLGGRYDTYKQDDQNNVTGTEATQKGNAFSPRLGIVYQPRETISLYGNYSKSFQPQIGRSFSGDAFSPTRGEQFEVGAKADLMPGLTGTAAVFRVVQSNVTTPDPDNVGFSVQTGEQRSQGFELNLSGRVLPGWDISASYAYLDAETTRSNSAAILGRRVQRTSPHNASLWSSYEVKGGSLEGLGFGGGVFFVDDRPIDNANTVEVPGYTTFDAALFYRLSSLRFALNLKNITDEDAFDAFGVNRVTYGNPRTVEATVSWSF